MRSGLSLRLRDATREAHQSLETAMPPLAARPTPEGFRFVLRRFYGFHRVWERGLARHPELTALLQDRGRMAHLERDLAALGVSGAELERLPRCARAAELTVDPGLALGSLYVMEGSTLGGQLISRAIVDADWAPAGGLTYFNPYGPRTGLMWRALQSALDAVPEERWGSITDGALRTFALLHDWMGGDAPPPPLS